VIQKTFTTGAAYTQANTIGPDPSGVSVVAVIGAPCTIEVFYGSFGQQVSMGELALQQSTSFAGATGAKFKDTPGTAGAVSVTVYLFQTKDPLPSFISAGATQVVAPAVVLTGDVSAAGAINSGSGFTVAGTTGAAGGLVVTFNTAYANTPVATVVLVTANTNRDIFVSAISTASVTFKCFNSGGAAQNERVQFTVQPIV
jgi:hypothetical protein